MLETSPAETPGRIRRSMTMPLRFSSAFSVVRAPVLVLGLSAAFLLAACGSSPRRVSYETEEFDSTTTHTRTYAATEAQTCEAALIM